MSYEKNSLKKRCSAEHKKLKVLLKLRLVAVTATLDCITNKCSEIITDGEKTKNR